jgi:hypothetical protein
MKAPSQEVRTRRNRSAVAVATLEHATESDLGFESVIPHVDGKAEAVEFRRVRNAKVIVVEDAMYRGSNLSGTFLIAEGKEPKIWRNGDLRVQCDFTWYGWTPIHAKPSLLVEPGKFKIVNKYTGKVIDKIGRKI